MGFLDSKSKKAAKIFLKNNPHVDVLEEWDDMSIAEREKIFKDYFCDTVRDDYQTDDPMRTFHTFTFVSHGKLYNFGKMIVNNPEKEAKKEFLKLPEILRADIIQLFRHGYKSDKMQNENDAKLQRMDESNVGRGLNRSGNARFTDTWRIGEYSITCTVEYWANDDTANASWFGGTDYKIGGASIPCYAIYIKIDPTPEYYRLKDIHSWIRQVRPFKGHFGPGNISQHWKTNQTGQEEEILKEIHPCLLYGFAGVRYEKERTAQELSAIKEKAEENLLRSKQQKHEEWVRSGGPEREAKKAREAEARRKYAEEAAEHRAIEERAEAAAAKEKARQESFTQAKYEKLAIVGSWWNDLSKKEKEKYIENESMVNYEKVLYGDLGAIPKSTDNFDEMFDSAKDIVVDWYKKYGAKSSPTKRRRWFR